MNIIKPTPSQAAVALKKFLARHQIDIKLSLAQEAIAVTEGYPSWNVLAADVPVRDVKSVPLEKPLPVEPVAPAEPEPSGPTLQELIDMNTTLESQGVDDADMRMHRIYYAMQTAAVNSDLLDDWTYQAGRGERWMEGDKPMIQVSFDRSMGRRFATEIVLTLRDNKMAAYVRTWQFFDEEEPARNYGIFQEEEGYFDTDATLPDLNAPLSELIKNAVAEANDHKTRLRQELGLD